MTTIDDIRAWVDATRPTDWYGKCAGLTDRVVAAFTGGDRQWYDSATDARAASGGLNPDPAACPSGGIHFWSYYGTAWDGSYGNWGHVTIDIDGGGTATLSATAAAYEYWGVNAGLISVAAQSQRAGMRYLGWARTYGAAAPLAITSAATAGDSATPFNPATPDEPEEDSMKIITSPDGAQKFVDEFGADDIGDSFFANDPFTWTDNILAAWKLTGVDSEKGEIPAAAVDWKQFELIRHIANARWDRKRGQIVTDVITSLKPLLAEVAASVAGISPEKFAELIEKGLTDVVVKAAPISDADRAAIAKAVVDEQAKRLAK